MADQYSLFDKSVEQHPAGLRRMPIEPKRKLIKEVGYPCHVPWCKLAACRERKYTIADSWWRTRAQSVCPQPRQPALGHAPAAWRNVRSLD